MPSGLIEPANLPAWETQQGRELRPAWDVVRMAAGEPRIRRTVRSVPSVVSLRRFLTPAQMTTWWTWWRANAIDGLLAFQAPAAALGSGVEVIDLTFLEPPRLTPQGGGAVWLIEAQAVTGGLVVEQSGGGGGGGGGGGSNPPRDEWHVVGRASFNTGLGDNDGPRDWGTSGATRRIWDEFTSGFASDFGTPQYFYLQRRTIARIGPPSAAGIVSDVLNTSTTPPTTAWAPTADEPSPVLEVFDAAQGLWRVNRDAAEGSFSGIAFGPMGTFTIGGPGAGLRTVISRTPGLYPGIAWEYVWQD